MCGPGGVRTHHPRQEMFQQGNREYPGWGGEYIVTAPSFPHAAAHSPNQLHLYEISPASFSATPIVYLERVHVTLMCTVPQ